MASILASRLDRLEARVPASKKPWRAVTVVAGEGQDAEVARLLQEKGFDAEAEDLVVIRLVVVPSEQEPYSKPPYILRHTQ